jgi:hypothetical protein
MKKVKMTLVGLDGNAFVLLGMFQNKAKQQGWTKEEIMKVIDDATSSDYEHLLRVLSSNITGTEEEDDYNFDE